MKVLHQINYLGGLGADRWIGEGFKHGFESLGHEFFWLTARDDMKTRLDEIKPDILMIAQGLVTSANVAAWTPHRERGMKVVLRVDSFFDQEPEAGRILKESDPADLYYGEVERPWIDRFTEITGKPYHVITQAANPKYHFPTEPVKKYECDIVFLGAMMPNKRAALEELLIPLTKKYNVKIYGPNWTAKDNAMRLAAYGARKIGWMGLNKWISDLRITVPPEDENKLYSSAKISVNIHERGDHIKNHIILNERTFKIPASGGFEICDFVPPLRNYFTEEEMVMADDRKGDWIKDWFEKIDYYLKNTAEREAIRARGIARAHKDHMYGNRVQQILNILNLN
jgi:spore maturation protein CgeB